MFHIPSLSRCIKFMLFWRWISIHPRNENQIDALFTVSLFRQSASTRIGHVCSPSSGCILCVYVCTHTHTHTQGIHRRMVRFLKLTINLCLTLHGHNLHRQQQQMFQFLMRYQQFACHAYCGAAGPVSKMASQQEEAFCVCVWPRMYTLKDCD